MKDGAIGTRKEAKNAAKNQDEARMDATKEALNITNEKRHQDGHRKGGP